MKTIAILIFDGAEEMDFVGPLEVLAAAAEDDANWRVVTVAENRCAITCEKGMRVLPDHVYSEIKGVDVLVVPGGGGARRETENKATVQWLESIKEGCTWLTSVCTGAFLLVGSGLAAGKKVTTHHRFIDQLNDLDLSTVVENVRFVSDGRVVTAGGVMSGIEMSLWLIGQIWGEDKIRRTRDYIAYDFPLRETSQTNH
ncbi:DJ-1/PfpI family protein [Rhodobacteraceae bacterium]|nr:DJ-1/PfpI family protein [Paracoccaceae bacterium]